MAGRKGTDSVDGASTANLSAMKRIAVFAQAGFAFASRFVYLTFGLVLIFGSSYLIGHRMLEGTLGGNDTPWALSLVMWLDRWFPNIPIWYPLQGGGTPLTVAYPIGTHLLVVLVHRLFELTEVQAFRLVGFLSVPTVSSGIYFLVWSKLRNQSMALLAGLFYLISAAAWTWLNHIGLFAQAVSLIYVAPAFLFFDACIDIGSTEGSRSTGLRGRLALLSASVAYGLMFLSHMATALSFSMAVLLYALLLPVLSGSSESISKAALISLSKAIRPIVAGLGMVAFWLVPFLSAQGEINREGLSEFAAHQIPYTNLAALLGLGEPPTNYGIWSVQFAVPVAALAACGLVIALWRNKKIAAWGITAVCMAVYTAMPGLVPGVVAVADRLWAYSHIRAISITMILLPAVAGFGAWLMAELLVNLPWFLVSRLSRAKLKDIGSIRIIRPIKNAAIFGLALGIAAGAVLSLRLSPHQCNKVEVSDYPNGEAFWPFCFSNQGIRIRNEPQFALSARGPDYHQEAILQFASELELDATTRMDVSAFLGTLTQTLSLYTDASIIGIYNYQSSMIHAMWGFLQGVMYSNAYGTPHEMNQLATWFGIRYVALNLHYDPLQKYDQAEWPVVFPLGNPAPGMLQIRGFPNAPGMASLLNTPAFLAIGGFENGSYDQLFRVSIAGAVNFEDCLIVEGTHNIDDYSLEALRNFEGVVLHGYGYRNKDRAWQLLDEYVQGGGALYVDTGWQYYTPDWEMAEAPTVLPILDLKWSDFGLTSDFSIVDREIAIGIDEAEFAPLVWEDEAWSVSSPSKGLRDWGRAVLEVGGNPIIVAGQYGNGRVVWSGMNLVGHAYANDNYAERELIQRLMRWLSRSPAKETLGTVSVVRSHPDHIEFVLTEPVPEGMSLLWRESFSTDWRASLEVGGSKTKIPIYRAGPGMMLLRLPRTDSPGAIVRMDYRLGWKVWMGVGVSLLTLSALIAKAIFPNSGQIIRRRWIRFGEELTPDPRLETDSAQIPMAHAHGDLEEVRRSSSIEPDISTRNGSDEADFPWTVDARAVSDPEKARALWDSLQNSRTLAEDRDVEANRLIMLWRSSRSRKQGQGPTSEG